MAKDTYEEVPIEKISPNRVQPRRIFSSESIEKLAQSIKTQGIIQPLIVRATNGNDHFELVAGERRWRALRQIGVAVVPVVIKNVSNEDLLEVALLENIQRENLTPVEEAQAYKELLETHQYTQEHLAKRIGKDRSTIANLVRLLQLPSAVLNDLDQGRLTIGHARPLLALPGQIDQIYFREKILKNGWSVRRTEQEVKQYIVLLEGEKSPVKGKKSKKKESKHQYIQDIETKLQQRLSCKVAIQHKTSGSGTIEIKYSDLDEFDRLFAILLTESRGGSL